MRTTEYETLPENNGKENVVRRGSPTSQETDFPEHETTREKIFWCLDNGITDAKEIMEKYRTGLPLQISLNIKKHKNT